MILQKILGQGGPGPQGPRPPGSAGDEPKMFDTQSAQHFYSERNLKRTYLCFDTNLASAGGISRQTFVNFFASEPRRFSSRVKRQPRLFPTTDGKSTKQQRRITQQRTRLSLCVFGAAHSANITNWCIHIHGCVNSVKQLQAAMHQWIQKQSWSVFFLSDHKKKKNSELPIYRAVVCEERRPDIAPGPNERGVDVENRYVTQEEEPDAHHKMHDQPKDRRHSVRGNTSCAQCSFLKSVSRSYVLLF